MAERYEIHKTLCDGINNKIDEDRHKVQDTICKISTEKIKIATFDEALEKSRIKLSGITKEIKDDFIKKWEKGEPIYVMGKKLDVPGKEEIVSEEIKCDISMIRDVGVKAVIEEMKMLKNTKELMGCK